MNRRTILKRIAHSLALLTSASWSSSAFADGKDEDEHDDEGHENRHGSDDEDAGKIDSMEKDGTIITSLDDDDDDDRESHDHDEYEDEEHALQATQSNQAIPLRTIIREFRRDIGGTITEITLFQRRDTLIYRFQYINKNGHVVFVKYDAATGQKLEE